MTHAGVQSPGVVLDACAVLSLYATSRMDEIVRVLPPPVVVADLVVEEALYIRRVIEGEVAAERVDLTPLIDSGMLGVVQAETEQELLTFIDLAVDLDDGEAMSGALAMHRGWPLVTDDRKAERLLDGRVQLRSTLDVIREWAAVQRIGADELRAALASIDERGYRPGKRHPLSEWWEGVIAEN